MYQESQNQMQEASLCSAKIQSIDNSQEQESKKDVCVRQKLKISKLRKQRRVRLIGVPIIMKNILKSDSEPIFIYNLIKMMKKYDADELEKYKYFGIQSAGIGSIANIKLDKINQFIDLEISLNSLGESKFDYLINLYKSYQNQDYFDLALLLEQYQIYIKSQFDKTFFNVFQQVSQIPDIEQYIDENFIEFENHIKDWVNEARQNDIMLLCLGQYNVKKRQPLLKKQLLPHNLIQFVSGDLESTYEKIINYQNFDFVTSFLRDFDNYEENERYELDKQKETLKLVMKNMSVNDFEFEYEDYILTLDGIKLPCRIKVQLLFYDNETKQISNEPGLYYFIINQLNFDLNTIEYLMQMRQQNLQNSLQIYNQNFQESYKSINLDQICQQEYFLEKFDYQTNKNDIARFCKYKIQQN